MAYTEAEFGSGNRPVCELVDHGRRTRYFVLEVMHGFKAIEQDAMRMSSTMRLEIIVVDADDNVPTCGADKYTARIDHGFRKLIMDQPVVVSDADQVQCSSGLCL